MILKPDSLVKSWIAVVILFKTVLSTVTSPELFIFLIIKSLEQQLEMVLNFLDVFKQRTNNLFILATRSLKEYAFVFLNFI